MTKRASSAVGAWAALLLGFALSQAPGWAAQPKHLELGWEELDPAIVGRKAIIILSLAERVEGRVLAVGPDGLKFQVNKSTNQQVYPKGRALLPRPAVLTIQLKEKGIRWRVVGVSAGLAAGVASAVAINPIFGPAGREVAAASVLIGLPVAGYFLGNVADRKVTVIRVIPAARGSDGATSRRGE